jgi:Family of unknown function (DUF6625)
VQGRGLDVLSDIRKLMICPWFGPLPNWMIHWANNVSRLGPLGYDFLVYQDLPDFKRRVEERLEIECPIEPGTGKIHDYRCAFGVLFADEIKGYDFWGHTDFDCLYGRVDKWVTDDFLGDLDIHSNHATYVCGPWTLYRNSSVVNEFFKTCEIWDAMLTAEQTTGWVETEFSRALDIADAQGEIFRVYTMWQTKDLNRFTTLRWGADGALYEGDEEIFMAHFRRLNPKVYPRQCQSG